MRSYLVVALELDAPRVTDVPFRAAGISPVVCQSVETLPPHFNVDAIVVAISNAALDSTAYQSLVLAVLASAPEDIPRWLLMLDRVQLPLGFAAVQELPELVL